MDYITSARLAEVNAARRMREELGFTDAVETPVGPDGGIDVAASNALAQVKYETTQTGRPTLQQLYGARGLDRDREMLFFGAAGYSRHAIEYADVVSIALFTLGTAGARGGRGPHRRRRRT